MSHQPSQRQQAAIHQQIAGKRQNQRGYTCQDVHAQSIASEHGGTFGHQAPAGDLQATQVAGIDRSSKGGQGDAVDTGQMLHVGKLKDMAFGHRCNRR